MPSNAMARDRYYAAPPLFHRAANPEPCGPRRIPWQLTPREAEVAALIARGWSSREIAASLGISLHTVRRHTERIFDKTGVRSRTRLIVLIGLGDGDAPVPLRLATG